MARDKQVDLREQKAGIHSKEDRDRFVRDVLDDPGRRMLSTQMEAVLARALRRSVRAGEPWRLIGNGTLLGRVTTPPLRSSGIEATDHPELAFLDKFTDLFWRGDNGLPDSLDAWDGYPAARRRFYQTCAAEGARDLLALSGDSHAFWSNRLIDDLGNAMGVELGTAGITSPSMFDLAHCKPELIAQLDKLYASTNPDVVWTDSAHRGYVRLQLARDAAIADFVAVETGVSRGYRTSVLRTDHISREAGTLVSERE
jgi:alkaline phosphatase D